MASDKRILGRDFIFVPEMILLQIWIASSVAIVAAILSSVAGDCTAIAKLLQLRRAKAPVAQRLFGMFTRHGWWTLDCAGRAAKTWRWRRLCDAILHNESSTKLIVRILRRLVHAQDRCEANIGTFHDLAPFIARLGEE